MLAALFCHLSTVQTAHVTFCLFCSVVILFSYQPVLFYVHFTRYCFLFCVFVCHCNSEMRINITLMLLLGAVAAYASEQGCILSNSTVVDCYVLAVVCARTMRG